MGINFASSKLFHGLGLWGNGKSLAQHWLGKLQLPESTFSTLFLLLDSNTALKGSEPSLVRVAVWISTLLNRMVFQSNCFHPHNVTQTSQKPSVYHH